MQKVFEVDVDGVKRGFRFNMLAFGKACRIEKCDITELFDRMIGNKEENRQPDIVAMLSFFFAAAENYTEGKGQKVDYTQQDVSDWLDTVGLAKAMDMMQEGLKTVKSKNQEAPIESGQ